VVHEQKLVTGGASEVGAPLTGSVDGSPATKRSGSGSESPQFIGNSPTPDRSLPVLRKSRTQVFLQVGPAKDTSTLTEPTADSPTLDPDSPSQRLGTKTKDRSTGTLTNRLARTFSFQLKEGMCFPAPSLNSYAESSVGNKPVQGSFCARSSAPTLSALMPRKGLLFGVPLVTLMPNAHSPPMHLVRILAKLEGAGGIETPGIFLDIPDKVMLSHDCVSR
jgi:hypothetical protein